MSSEAKLWAPGALTIVPVTRDDLTSLATLHFLAMNGTDLRTRIWPESRRPDVETMITHNIHFWSQKPDPPPFVAILKAVIPSSGVVVGYAIWHLPVDRTSTGGDPLPEEVAYGQAVAERKAKAGKSKIDLEIDDYTDLRYQALWDAAAAASRKKVMKGQPHWFLDGLFVDPEYQGRGVGKVLLDWGLKQADAEGLPSYLETSQQGLPVYLKNGFEISDYIVLPDNLEEGKEFVKPVMVRRPALSK